MLSPVRALSFTEVIPSVIMPSTGMLSPGLTTKMSPALTFSMGVSTSLPSANSVAVFGVSFIRPFSASVVLPLDLASRVFPTVIRVTIMAADSK